MATLRLDTFLRENAPALNWILYGKGTPEPLECTGCPFFAWAEVSVGRKGPTLCKILPAHREVEEATPICTGDEWREKARKEITAHLAVRATRKVG